MVTFDEAKTFLRIDGTDDDALINSLIGASSLYIANATGDEVDTSSELYNLAQKLLIAHWYENREPIGQANTLNFSLESILLQLRYTMPDTTTSGDTT